MKESKICASHPSVATRISKRFLHNKDTPEA